MTYIRTLSLFRIHILIAYLFIGFLSCQKPNDSDPPPDPPSSEKSIITFRFETTDNPGLISAVDGIISADTVRVLFPSGISLTALKPIITYQGKSISPANRISQNFSTAVSYIVTAGDGSTKRYTVVATIGKWTDSANIHIVGNENGYLYYWKNGFKTSLGTTITGDGRANAVAVSGNDVYVVGRIGYIAKLWKNGVLTNLTDGSSSYSDAKAIAITGNDVYIAGFEVGTNQIVMWKNGVKSVVANGAPTIYEDMGIGVLGNDVYICGNIGYQTYLWKNGVATKLSDSSYSSVSGLFLNGPDVYVSGREMGRAVYWKNGVKTVISSSQESYTHGIAVSGADVYVIGQENWSTAVYWKNGVKTALATSPSGYASANAIQILDTDVYIVGTLGGPVFGTDVCWKNGVRHLVSLTPDIDMATGEAYGIAVTRR